MPNKTLYIVMGIVLVLLIILIAFYEFGKTKGKQLGVVNLINPPSNANLTYTVSNTDGTISPAIQQIAVNCYNDMNGINWLGFHNTSLWQQVAGLSDGDLINVNNSFNMNYEKTSKYSFIQWIQAETFTSNESEYISSILSRLGAYTSK